MAQTWRVNTPRGVLRILSTTLILAVTAAPLSAQEYRETRLANGLLILAVTSPAAATLEVEAIYFAGHRDEGDSLRGIAHLTEHLAMRELTDGTLIHVRMARDGIRGGAVTDAAATIFSYSATASDAQLARIFGIEALRMTRLGITDAAVNAERERVAAEAGDRAADDRVREALFGAGRHARASSHRDLRRITRRDVQQWAATYYVPRNAFIVVTSPLPAAAVLEAAERIVGRVVAGSPQVRPFQRYPLEVVTRTIVPGPGIGANREVRVFAAPGIQHVDRLTLERELAVLQARLALAAVGLTADLTDDSPVALLAFRHAGDRPVAATVLDSMLPIVLAGPRTSAGPRSGRTTWWAACEAAGNWRYCPELRRARDAASTDSVAELPYLRALLGRSSAPAPQLWPARVRAAVSVANDPKPATTVSRWSDPDTSRWHWERDDSRLAWIALRGGMKDTVFVSAWLALPPDSLDGRNVAALEVFARTWASVRLPTGVTVGDELSRLGGSASVQSLPYPPLATSERFRMLNTPLTPPGLVGIQISAGLTASRWDSAMRVILEALLAGVPDAAMVQAELELQRRLLADAAASPWINTEVAMRRSAASGAGRRHGAWRPDPVPDQLSTVRALVVADVDSVPARLRRLGALRMVVLGIDRDAVRPVVAGLPLPGGEWLRPATRECGAPSPQRIASTAARASVAFTLCVAADAVATAPVMSVVNAVLGGREDALLAALLRGQTGLAYDFESRMLPTADAALWHWQLRIGTQTHRAPEAIAAVQRALDSAATRGMHTGVITEFRDWLAIRRVERTRTGEAWTLAALTAEMPPEAEASRLRRVTPAQVNAVLRRFTADRLSTTAP